MSKQGLVLLAALVTAPFAAAQSLSNPPVSLSLTNGSVSANVACTTSGCTLTDSGLGILSITASSVISPQIGSFTGCGGSVELGAVITNPTCVATYTGGTPTSAVITNSEGVDSPLTLTNPYTSGTIVGSFVHATVATATITLTMNGSQTATQTYTWKPAIFGGVGASGVSSTVTANGTTAVLSNGAALARAQLGAETVGQVLGPYAATGQNVYLLLTGGTHTFIDNGTGLPFAFSAPVTVNFVNANGATVTMYLYASTNPLYGTFNIKVAS